MTAQSPAERPRAAPAAAAGRGDYTGAVYGSLLAASVVVGAGALGSFPRLELILLLLGTGVVFWAAHVFARFFGQRIAYVSPGGPEIRRICVSERPILEAAVPPALAVAASPLLGLDLEGTVWLALGVAVAGQVGWAVVAAFRAGASGRIMLAAGAVNLVLGLLIVAFKVALKQ
ncbi:hypothetical protein E3E14_26625 [Streptomyces sp. ICN441]|uniref:Integral membrane protein n=1 Tax=Streptomyces tirandamycinicus TaxID=2174846 RepID=A0A2S1SPK9_9ACTN|nr:MULTISPECIES: hypothetical protein [Streptomyces]AWI28348.1 hypothetical protein DDW44_05750 [Streptomyces tirandamycinicus]TFE38886.1 hypothetical protein E3E14_26625 [Streptomyces sp. ICN441]